jgi:prepilin-type processing-associated H-X9-DG protein/prepilin-type N-terminal cleavage/methylation domain-containing protein
MQPPTCLRTSHPVRRQPVRDGRAPGRAGSSAGFTLVELLVVCVVLATLAAILLPVLAHARERARQSVCLSQMRQITQAHMLYLQDWDERFPGWWQDVPPRPEPFGPHLFWTELLLPYLSHTAIFQDPSAIWSAPPVQGLKLADYALLTRGPSGMGTLYDPYWRWAGPPLSLAQVLRPAETLGLTEGYTTTKDTQGLLLRHSGGTNAGFLDGHVRWITWAQAVDVLCAGTGACWYRYVAADR